VFDENGRFRRSIHLIAWESEDLVGIEPYIAVDGEGRIYVTDSVKGAVHQISSDGNRVTTWGLRGGGPGQLEKPSGIAITAQGEVAVADRNQCRISIFKPR
jgi:DNA-binding beta-propeller fold protein YncE